MFRRSGPLSAILDRFRKDRSGATAIEYGLIMSLMFLAIVTACQFFGAQNTVMYQRICDAISSVVSR
jgi:pilus assembly protein Flp/PilA